MLCTHKTASSASLVLEICPQFNNSYLNQFSSISGGNCITAGRGRHGGRGRGRGRNVRERGDDHILMNSEEAHTQQVEPNLDIMDTPYLSPHHDCVLASSSAGGKPLPQRWILLDSCSSANLISDRTLLHNVHQAARPLVVH